MLIGLLDARSDVQQGLLIAIAVMVGIAPWALLSLVVMMVSMMTLMWWARSPVRGIHLRTGAAMCVCMLSMALGMLALQHLTANYRLAGTVMYMGIGGAALMFMQIVVPNWEDRGFLRHPKGTPAFKQPAQRP